MDFEFWLTFREVTDTRVYAGTFASQSDQ